MKSTISDILWRGLNSNPNPAHSSLKTIYDKFLKKVLLLP